GETRSASRSFRLGFVSVEATISSETTFFREGEEAELTVRRASLDGTPRAGRGRFTLFALDQPEQALLPADQPLEPLPGADRQAGFETAGDRQRERWAPGYAPESVLRQWKDAAERGGGPLTHDDRGEARVALPSL